MRRLGWGGVGLGGGGRGVVWMTLVEVVGGLRRMALCCGRLGSVELRVFCLTLDALLYSFLLLLVKEVEPSCEGTKRYDCDDEGGDVEV